MKVFLYTYQCIQLLSKAWDVLLSSILYYYCSGRVHLDWNTHWRHHTPRVKCHLSGALLWAWSTYKNWLLLASLPTEQSSLVHMCTSARSLFITFISTGPMMANIILGSDVLHVRVAGEVSKQSGAKLHYQSNRKKHNWCFSAAVCSLLPFNGLFALKSGWDVILMGSPASREMRQAYLLFISKPALSGCWHSAPCVHKVRTLKELNSLFLPQYFPAQAWFELLTTQEMSEHDCGDIINRNASQIWR